MKKKNGDIKKILDKENKIYFIKRLYELINHGYMLEDSLEFLLIQYDVADDEIKKIKSSEAYEKTVQSQVTAYEINEKDKDVTFEKLVEKHYLDGPADKASTAPNGKKIVIANGKATLQK